MQKVCGMLQVRWSSCWCHTSVWAAQTVVCINLVQVTVQPVVDDGVKILQAASVKCIENISACPGLLEPGVHLIRVFQLKQEIWHRGRNLLVFRQFKKICELEIKKNTVSRWAKDILDCVCVCVWQYTSSFCKVFTAKLFEERIQWARARWCSPSLGRSRTNSLTPGKDFTSANWRSRHDLLFPSRLSTQGHCLVNAFRTTETKIKP